MFLTSIVLTWNGRALTAAQELVVQRVAEKYESAAKGSSFEFEHELCEGLLTCKGSGSLGTFAGAIFHAYLGEVDNAPWTYEFMLVAGGSRESDFPDDASYIKGRAVGDTYQIDDLAPLADVKPAKSRRTRKH